MPQAIVDPGELRRFAQNLKQFNAELQNQMAVLQGQLLNLGATWRDQENQKFVDEFESTVQAVLLIRESELLLRENAVLQSAIALRNPYVDPLSLIQIALLKRKHQMAGEDERARKSVDAVLATTLSGIAQGLRNTG